MWFLRQLGSNRLTTNSNTALSREGGLTGNDRKPIKGLGKKRYVGIDIAGPESQKFTPEGMKRWQNVYSQTDAKAQADDGTYAFRTHVGEGSPELDADGNVAQNSPHVEIANHNAGMIVDTLVGMNERREFSDNVVTRLGHMTHSDFEQLSKLDPISQEHGVIVEANLTSNLVTGSVPNPDERDRVLLKFLYQDNLRVTLNTDGDGVMNTTIDKEYGIAQGAINDFKSGKTTLIDEKGMTIYYYDETQVPHRIPRNLRKYNHVAIPESKKKNFNIERLEKESDRYIDDIVPTLGSQKQREENLESIAWHRRQNKNNNNTSQETTTEQEKN